MKNTLSCLACFVLIAITTIAEPIKVVSTVPDLAEFTRKVGGDRVDVYCMISGVEDPHNVMIKPSMITKLAQADLFIEIGLEAEHAYAPALLVESRNSKIQVGKQGFLDTSTAIHVIEVPERLDRSEGDQHAFGSHHYNLDPVRVQQVVRLIAKKLSEFDPGRQGFFEANAKAYNEQLDVKLKEWTAKLAGKNTKFVSYHPSFGYFAERFGVQPVGMVQSKPGVEPGPKHIEELVQLMKSTGVKLILKESFYSDRFPQEIAARTGARVVNVPILVKGTPEATDYFKMMDQLVDAFVR